MSQEQQWAQSLQVARRKAQTKQSLPLAQRKAERVSKMAYLSQKLLTAIGEKDQATAQASFHQLIDLRITQMYQELEEEDATFGFVSDVAKQRATSAMRRDCVALALQADTLRNFA